MTPTEQDKELSEKLRVMIRGYLRNYTDAWFEPVHADIARDSSVYADDVLALITADRKRVALEARIDELESLARSVHENTGSRSGASIRGFNTAVRYYRENIQSRIAELKRLKEVKKYEQSSGN